MDELELAREIYLALKKQIETPFAYFSTAVSQSQLLTLQKEKLLKNRFRGQSIDFRRALAFATKYRHFRHREIALISPLFVLLAFAARRTLSTALDRQLIKKKSCLHLSTLLCIV